MELQEELSPADAVLLMSSVPERIGDLVYGLDEAKLRYRHGPAFPTLGGLIGHLLESGSKVDALLRRAPYRGGVPARHSSIDPPRPRHAPARSPPPPDRDSRAGPAPHVRRVPPPAG